MLHKSSGLFRGRLALDGEIKNLFITGWHGPAWACSIAEAVEACNRRPILVVVKDQARANRAVSELSLFSPCPVLNYPCHENMPFVPLFPDMDTVSKRISALYALAINEEPVIVVAPVQALFEATVPWEFLNEHIELLAVGGEVERESFVEWLIRAGYERTRLVKARGEFAVKGGIIDIFPPDTPNPVRLDFFGDELEGMRYFDSATQRSFEDVEELVLLPANEVLLFPSLVESAKGRLVEAASRYGWAAGEVYNIMDNLDSLRLVENQRALLPLFYENPAFLFQYMPEGSLVAFVDANEVRTAQKEVAESLHSSYREAREAGKVLFPVERFFMPEDEISSRLGQQFRVWIFSDFTSGGGKLPLPFDMDGDAMEQAFLGAAAPQIPFPVISRGKAEQLLGDQMDALRELLSAGDDVTLAVPIGRRAERLLKLLEHYGVVKHGEQVVQVSPPLLGAARGHGLSIAIADLETGFSCAGDGFHLISECDLLGIPARKPAKKKGRSGTKTSHLTFEELAEGDFIVHRDHGIGIYRGLVHMEAGGVPGEYLVLEYRGGDKLYLPVDRLGLVQKYLGIEGRSPRLDKLGGGSWQLVKKKIKKAIWEIAHELVDLYALRKVRQGHAFSPPSAMYRQFEAAFPFSETPDQAKAIEEILDDMMSPRPMDRLLCGDVGYGKTEVAMRAAFKAVEDGKQVAVLVPTTLLAEQHERTFRKRFDNFPVTIASLSRMKSGRQQAEVLKALREGRIDILIGTHRLLQRDVRFKELGLMIIDEEHRFGVRHKEQLKKMRQEVDCLTLTATPIPRTLQLSLLGIRDLSTIDTPPEDRIPVKTYLAELDDTLVRAAIKRELARGGQVFFIHNRVKGIERVADHIRSLVSGAEVAVAHGQMNPAELEMIMINFVRGDIDVLVCTTIVESGLDIPTANTVIINRADMLGLADIYQLRGRVGRSGEQAYAYFLVPRLDSLGKDALKRLKAVVETSVAGGGFKLAMKDLQIRGAGNILGVSQSGQIADVGYELYLDLLKSAVEELKGMPVEEMVEPEVNLAIPAYIPDSYIEHVEERLAAYRLISKADQQEAAEILEDLEDRFGPVPQEVKNLFELAEIKRVMRCVNGIRLDISRKRDGGGQLFVTFGDKGPANAEKVIKLATSHTHFKILPDERLVISLQKGQDGVAFVKSMLEKLK